MSADFPTYDINKDNDGTPAFEYQNVRNVGYGDQVYNYNNPFQLRYGTGDPFLNSSNKEIGAKLKIGIKSVDTYKTRLMEKLGIRNRVEIVQYAKRQGLMDEI